mgnify:CR=1 FL=1
MGVSRTHARFAKARPMTGLTGPVASSAGRMAVFYAGSLVCGAIADRMNLPLPWMLGALAFTMTASMSGFVVSFPRATRSTGQMIVAAAVGLTFTPAAVGVVLTMFPAMLAAAVLTILAALVVAVVLRRLAHVDAITAGLASMPLGPVESANIAGRLGIAEAPVVFAQVLRIVLLILIIPPALIWIDGTIADPTEALRTTPWTWPGAALLLVVAFVGGYGGKLMGVSNPFFLGPLATCATVSALGLPVTAFPYVLLVLGQLLLGTSLGATFRPDFLRSARGFIPAAFASALVLVALTTGIGLAMAQVLDLPWTVMVLATAPGSVTEMALTAKVLQQGVALVTAFHLTRIFLILPLAPFMFQFVARAAERMGKRPRG